ncbi:MAG: hypothetical protein GF421_13735 [Candidatus Aminicenantes bacterium]|nr:hypothetical protein [Candidatus Aminicenantes bacterium]
MSNQTDDFSGSASAKEHQDVDKKQLDHIKAIIKHIEKTFSQMKIFSSGHENVESFIDLLHDRLSEYLEKHWKLEIGIKEFSFTFKGVPFYTDKQISKSMPFLFYKDGLKMLFFYKGLPREELKDFIEIMKKDASSPPEESDIVISLWERDFSFIRYFAPDDYLETKIGAGLQIPEYKVDKKKLFSGKISLSPQDRSALETKQGAEHKEYDQNKDSQEIKLSKSDQERLTALLENHRKESEESQYKNLLLDVLYLEKRPEKVTSLVKQIIQYMNQQINAGHFHIVLSVYQKITELKKHLSESDPAREKSVQMFFESPQIRITLQQTEQLMKKDLINDFEAFLKYLSLLGSDSIPILSFLYDRIKKTEQKNKITETLKQVGKQNLSELIKITRDEKPELTLEIISILRDSKEKRAVNYLASFFSFQNKKVLESSIKALGAFRDPNANKILFSLLSHENPDLRTLASENIHVNEKDPVFHKILEEVKEKKFSKQSQRQKQALFLALARSKSPKAFDVLEQFIKRAGFFSRGTKEENALCALSALEQIKDPHGYEIIKKRIRSRNRKIRKQCKKIIKHASGK